MTDKVKTNASQLPRIFYARHMQPGICGYEDEKVLVDTDALKKMIATGAAMPVYIHHQTVDIPNLKETAAGYVTDSFYNELDGWAWFKIIAIDDEMHKAIDDGWSVSNAYRPTEWGQGGTKNNCPYDREITNAEFTHLAIVPNPRYEHAVIMTPDQFKNYQDTKKREIAELHNSKPERNKMFKLFKTTKQEVSAVDLDTSLELENGKSVTVREMLNAVKKNDEDEDAKKKKEKEEKEKKEKEDKANADQMVECDGEKMPLSELVTRFNKLNKKNDAETDEEKEKRLTKEKEDKKNAEDAAADKKRKDEEDKENAKHFEELKNAHLTVKTDAVMIEAPGNKILRGSQRYGSAK